MDKTKVLPKYEVKTIALSKLKDHPENPRAIKEIALKGLMTSIDQFGLIEPIIWNKRTGHIVGGHQRKKALEAAGYKEAQVLVVDFDANKEMLANLSLNNPKIQGTYTDDAVDFIEDAQERNGELTKNLLLDELYIDLAPEEKVSVKPEVPFTAEIFEEQNYVVLTFKNKADWVWLNSIFPLTTVKALDAEPGFEKQGVGRVVDGVAFLEAVTKR